MQRTGFATPPCSQRRLSALQPVVLHIQPAADRCGTRAAYRLLAGGKAYGGHTPWRRPPEPTSRDLAESGPSSRYDVLGFGKSSLAESIPGRTT